jgi:hypothetical protein
LLTKTLLPFAKEGCERACLMSSMKSYGAVISQQAMEAS